MRLRRVITAGAAAGLLVALAGCGDGDEPAGGEQNGDGANSPAEGAGTDNGADGAGTGGDEPATGGDGMAMGTFHDPDGEEIGTVELSEDGETTGVHVELNGLEPGFRGLHIHQVGECEPDSADPEDPEETGDFLSAGGHLNPDDVDHGEHVGDLPPLLVTDDGSATTTVISDRFTIEDLLDADGTAFMVHSEADNFAQIPERYGEADQDTLDTGDAGDRVACAVIE